MPRQYIIPTTEGSRSQYVDGGSGAGARADALYRSPLDSSWPTGLK